MFRIVETITAQKLTSLDKAALCELAQTAMDIEFDGIDGDFVEAGCGLGGAAIVLAHAKRRSRPFTVYEASDAGQQLSAHGADERLNVYFIPGPYEKTVAAGENLALIHLDCGEYESVRVLLERLVARLVPGGQIIIDDYKKEECKKAVDEYFRGKSGFQFVRKSRMHIIKN